jgi:hypothetical protein
MFRTGKEHKSTQDNASASRHGVYHIMEYLTHMKRLSENKILPREHAHTYINTFPHSQTHRNTHKDIKS